MNWFDSRTVHVYFYRKSDIDALEAAFAKPRPCRPGEKEFRRPKPYAYNNKDNMDKETNTKKKGEKEIVIRARPKTAKEC